MGLFDSCWLLSSGFWRFSRLVKVDSTSLTFLKPLLMPPSISVTALFKLSVTQETALKRSVMRLVFTLHDFFDPLDDPSFAINSCTSVS